MSAVIELLRFVQGSGALCDECRVIVRFVWKHFFCAIFFQVEILVGCNCALRTFPPNRHGRLLSICIHTTVVYCCCTRYSCLS